MQARKDPYVFPSNNTQKIKCIICMGSVATFMIVLIMKLIPQIKLCALYKYGNITYKTR